MIVRILIVASSHLLLKELPLKQALLKRKHWIFDMDGTLTIAQHDFDAIRRELGLSEGVSILEALAKLPTNISRKLYIRIDEIGLEIARQAKPAEGASEFLDTLKSRGVNMGIVTRNNLINVNVTLEAAGLSDYFLPENCVSRDCAPPKPSPVGIMRLLEQWGAKPNEAVMVGDYHYDLHAGKNAGTATIYIDPSGEFLFKDDADVCIKQLTSLVG